MPERPPRDGALEAHPRLRAITLRGAVFVVITVAVAFTLVAAALMLVVNPSAFRGFGDAVWWAVVTLGTVGYGDVVPTNPSGRAVASLVILLSMGVFPVLTGLLTAILVERAQREARARSDAERDRQLVELRAQLDAIAARLGAAPPTPPSPPVDG